MNTFASLSAGEFTGTAALIRLILRRDWVKFLIWIVLVGLVPISMAAGFAQLYPTTEALQGFADLIKGNPSQIGVLGFVYNSTLGGLLAWRAGLNGAFLIVPVSILFVIRHTRSEEEAGRRELLGGTAIGRLAPLTAALIVVFGANFIIGAFIASGLIGQGLPAAGAITFGLSAASAGCVFSALAGVTAQLTESPGPARGIALTIFAAFWLMRAAGDLSGGAPGAEGWLSWLSPLGWVRLTRAFAGEQWWVFLLFLAIVVVLVAGAFALSTRRDLGAGLLPARLGSATADSGLRSPLALAWRLQRSSLIAWAAGAAFFGFLLGVVGVSISGFVDAPQFREWSMQMGLRNPGDAFLFLLMYILGQVVSAYTIAVVLRLRSEEVEGRADPVLATPVSRLRWMGSHLFCAALNSTILLLVLGLTIGLGYGLNSGDLAYDLPRLLARTLTTLPAVWLMAGIAAALYGLLPRFAVAGTWGVLVIFLILELGWELQQISQAVFNISPFAYVHWSIQVTALSLMGLTLVAAALIGIGLFGFQRRDVV
jgi:ABC-2 type transport system permease protein